MTIQHPDFDQLSELLDDDISEETRQDILRHLKGCSACRGEYDALNRCMCYVTELREETFELPGLSSSTITIYRARLKRRQMLKAIPAIAASVIIVAGVGMTMTGYFTPGNTPSMALSEEPLTDTQRVISSIRNANGKILKMTDMYIDGAVTKEQLGSIESALKDSRIKYRLFRNPVIAYSQKNSGNRNLEDVALTNRGTADRGAVKISKVVKEKNTVIIRIFR